MTISYGFLSASELGLREHADLAALLAQLAPHRSMLPLAVLQGALRTSTHLLVAREPVIRRIVGMSTIVEHVVRVAR